MLAPNLQKAIDQSVQTAQINKQDNPLATDGLWDVWGVIPHPEIISPWGWRRRDQQLRAIAYAVHNTLFQGAVAGLIMRVQATPWEIKAGRNIARYYQDMLQNSDFHDWETWLARTLWDFFTQDFGAVCEVIGAGDPSKPISGRVLGLAQMDSLSCYATKVNEYPIIYWNEEDNSMHRMEQTRVHRFTDMVSPRRLAYGNGLCALSRYLSEANVDILLGRHDNEMLNDLPPAGLLTVSGMEKNQWTEALSTYEGNRNSDGEHTFRQTMVVFSIDPTNEVKANLIPFSALPQNFDTEKFINSHVNKLALALGVDPQDIWPLSGQALGTGTQSTILHSKAQGKMFGRVLQMITRFINRKVLPDGAEFAFKFKDTEGDQETANTAKVWIDAINSVSWLTDEEKRRLAADQIEPIRDVITDENGELVELPDDDPKEDQQIVIAAPDANPLGQAANQPNIQANLSGTTGTPNAANVAGGTPATVSDQRKSRLLLDRGHVSHAATKDYPDTKSAFIDAVQAVIDDANSGATNRASSSIRLRSSINQYGKLAYLDGLEQGGVTDEWSDSDSSTFADLLAGSSQYVTGLMDTIYKSDGGLTGTPDLHADMWGNKTLNDFYYAGLESADKNGMYVFTGNDGDESCATCQRLKGVSHRMSWWVKNELRPGVDTANFECGGWRCQHLLEKRAA